MSCRIIVALFLAVIATTHAGFFDDVSGKATEVGNFFTKQFNNVKDLFAGNQSELEKNVDRVKGLLMEIKEKMKMLEPMANDAQKKTLSQIGNYLDEVTQFGDKVAKDGQTKFQENSAKWQDMLNNMFQKGGLSDVMKLLNLKSASQCTILLALSITPIVLTFFN